MSLPQLSRVVTAGTKTVVQLALEGELSGGRAWVAAKGAAKYLAAIAEEDLADPEVVESRGGRCRVCPARREPGPDDLATLGWCGEPLVERLSGPLWTRSCGCLLDGKVLVKSERCPRGWW